MHRTVPPLAKECLGPLRPQCQGPCDGLILAPAGRMEGKDGIAGDVKGRCPHCLSQEGLHGVGFLGRPSPLVLGHIIEMSAAWSQVCSLPSLLHE